jgi:hypothetical protein
VRLTAALGARAVVAATLEASARCSIGGYPRCTCGGPLVPPAALGIEAAPGVLACASCPRRPPATDEQLHAAAEAEADWRRAKERGRDPQRKAASAKAPRAGASGPTSRFRAPKGVGP